MSTLMKFKYRNLDVLTVAGENEYSMPVEYISRAT